MKVRLKKGVSKLKFSKITFGDTKGYLSVDINRLRKDECKATIRDGLLTVDCFAINGVRVQLEYLDSDKDIWEVVE